MLKVLQPDMFHEVFRLVDELLEKFLHPFLDGAAIDVGLGWVHHFGEHSSTLL